VSPAFVLSAPFGDVRSLDVFAAIDARRVVAGAPLPVVEARSDRGARAFSAEIRRPHGRKPAIRLCAVGTGRICSEWWPLPGHMFTIRLTWSHAGARLVVGRVLAAALTGPLAGRADRIRFGAGSGSPRDSGALHLDSFRAART
jgi:hypothetical protein